MEESTIPIEDKRESIEPIIEKIITRLTKEFKPKNIFLFGSHVWGTPDKDSDLDLLIIINHSDLSSAKRASNAYRALRDIPYPLDILVRTQKEIERYSHIASSIESKILRQGKCLYDGGRDETC